MSIMPEEPDDYRHPLGGYDLKLMAEQLAAVMDRVSAQELEILDLKAKIEGLGVQAPSPLGVWQPRNWRNT